MRPYVPRITNPSCDIYEIGKLSHDKGVIDWVIGHGQKKKHLRQASILSRFLESP